MVNRVEKRIMQKSTESQQTSGRTENSCYQSHEVHNGYKSLTLIVLKLNMYLIQTALDDSRNENPDL